jgi:hypothetical protein
MAKRHKRELRKVRGRERSEDTMDKMARYHTQNTR